MKWGMSPEARFWEYVNKDTPTGCWQWLGQKNHKFDPSFRVSKKPSVKVKAHRYSWELVQGPLPPKVQLKRSCKNAMCVNPEHMEVIDVAKRVERQKRYLAECREFYWNIKKSMRCARCGQNPHPAAMQFHHKDRATKKGLVNEFTSRSIPAIVREMEKCEPLCANCHMIHHWEERQAAA